MIFHNVYKFIIARFINAELKMMSAFLRTTSTVTERKTEVLKAYLELIRDLA